MNLNAGDKKIIHEILFSLKFNLVLSFAAFFGSFLIYFFPMVGCCYHQLYQFYAFHAFFQQHLKFY